MIKPIRNAQDHRRALERISELIDENPKPGSQECDELEVLGILITFYEDKQWTPRKPTPLEVIEHHMDRLGLSQSELARRAKIQQSHLSAVVNGRRPLSLTQAKKLAALFGVPLDRLVANEFLGQVQTIG